MFVGLMSFQISCIGSLIVTEITCMYHYVVDGRRVWRRLIKISFTYTYIQWGCAPGIHIDPRAHFSGTFHPVLFRFVAVARSRPPCPSGRRPPVRPSVPVPRRSPARDRLVRPAAARSRLLGKMGPRPPRTRTGGN